MVPGERWAFGRDELQGWKGYTRKGWRAARRAGRREGLSRCLLVERVLGLGLGQGVNSRINGLAGVGVVGQDKRVIFSYISAGTTIGIWSRVCPN